MSFRRFALVFWALSPLLVVVADTSSVRGGAALSSDETSSRELDELVSMEDEPQSFENGEPLVWKAENEAPDDPTCPLQRLLLDGALSGDEQFIQESLEESHRKLGIRCVTNRGIDYFDIEIAIHPRSSPSHCELADTVVLGNDINRLLWDYGVGSKGSNDRAVFVAAVCSKPVSNRRRLAPSMRVSGFVYPGIGSCRYCPADNRDYRRLFGDDEGDEEAINFDSYDAHTQRELASAWFTNTFKPQMEAALEDAVKRQLAPKHRGCLGLNPIVNVDVTGVNFRDLESPCADSNTDVVGHLSTYNLWHMLLNTRSGSCAKCIKIDFSDRRTADWVKDQYYNRYGVKFFARPTPSNKYATYTYIPNGKTRIFDTARPTNDADLGSPNENCRGGGPGKGNGGKRGSGGENCDPVGKVLIIQDRRSRTPNDSAGGGRIKISFKNPVLFSDIGMMDIEETAQTLRFTYSDNRRKTFRYKGFGDNGVQRVIANQYDVKLVEVFLPGSGAITEINFCPECN